MKKREIFENYDDTPLSVILEEEPDWEIWNDDEKYIHIEDACCYALNLVIDPTRYPWTHSQQFAFDNLITDVVRAGLYGPLTIKELGGEKFVDKREFAAWLIPHPFISVSDEFIARAEKMARDYEEQSAEDKQMTRPRKDQNAPRVPMTIRVSPWIRERLQAEAKANGKSLSETANEKLHSRLEWEKTHK